MEYIPYMLMLLAANSDVQSVPSKGMTNTEMVVFFSIAAIIIIPLIWWIQRDR